MIVKKIQSSFKFSSKSLKKIFKFILKKKLLFLNLKQTHPLSYDSYLSNRLGLGHYTLVKYCQSNNDFFILGQILFNITRR
jgi:hypothetical protein